MKKLFYAGLVGLALFEILNVYFIMPMPGSQQFESIGVAYFLYSYRWVFRILFGLMILAGVFPVFQTQRKWVPLLAALPVVIIVYFFNFRMTADHMFLEPTKLVFKSKAENTLNDSSLVVVVTRNMEAKAYPIRYICITIRYATPSVADPSWSRTAMCVAQAGSLNHLSREKTRRFASWGWITSMRCLKTGQRRAGGVRQLVRL